MGKRQRIVAVLAFLVLWLSTPAVGQQKSAPGGSPNVPVTSGQPSEATALGREVELEILRERNRLLEEHNNQLLQVTLWAIGFAAVFLLAVLGLIGFFTERRYQRDRNSLEQALDARVTKATADLMTKLAEGVNQLKAAMGTRAEEAITAKLNPITKQLSNLSNSVAGLEVQLTEMEAKDWERKGVLANALTSYLGCAKLARKVPDYDDWKVSECLEKISQLLEKGGRFDATEVTEVTAFLKSLPPSYEPLVKKIQRKLAA